jgi:hypothetical protein
VLVEKKLMSKLRIAPKGLYGWVLFIIFIAAVLIAWYLYIEATGGHPPSLASIIHQNIKIAGKTGATTYNVYIESNPTDVNGYYGIYRRVYDPIDYYFFDPTNFDTINEIKRNCNFLVRKQADSNSLLYTDWDVSVLSNDKYYYLYVVTQDDGDFSNCVIFHDTYLVGS